MKREHPSIALGTVYKHLNAYRITEPGSPDRYDRTERHDHLICSRCGRITDVRLPDMQEKDNLRILSRKKTNLEEKHHER